MAFPHISGPVGTDDSRHKRRALLAAMVVELIVIFWLYHWQFPEPPEEKRMEINFIPDDFDFSQLEKPEKIRIPDISEYLNTSRHLSSMAANDWQKEASETESFSENREDGSEETPPPQTTPAEDLKPATVETRPPASPQKVLKDKKSYTGDSRIRYFVPGRHKVYLKNPIYTCPDYMHGWISVKVTVDRDGHVVKAEFDPENSTASYGCLIDAALSYARSTRFNRDVQAPELTEGYIRYMF